MKYFYLLTLCIVSVIQGISQTPEVHNKVLTTVAVQDTFHFPTLENSIPVKAGDVFTIRTIVTGTGKKNKVLKIALQIIGAGAAAYQSSHALEGNKGKMQRDNNQNWILPAGIVLTLGADKIARQATGNTYLKYSLYSRDGKSILHTGIAKLTRKSLKQKDGILIKGTATEDGYLVPEINGRPTKGPSYNIVVNIEPAFIDKLKVQTVKSIPWVPAINTNSIVLPALSAPRSVPANDIITLPHTNKEKIVKVDDKKRLVPAFPEISQAKTSPVVSNKKIQTPVGVISKPVGSSKQQRSVLFFPPLYYRKEEITVESEEEEPATKKTKKKSRFLDPWLKFIDTPISMDDEEGDEGGYGIVEGECDGSGCSEEGEGEGEGEGEEEGEGGTQPGECDNGCSEEGEGDPGSDPGGGDPGEDPGGGDPGEDPGGSDPGGSDPGEDPGGSDPGGSDPGEDPGGSDPGGDPGGGWGDGADGFDDGVWDDGIWDDGWFDDGWFDEGGDDGSDNGGGDPDPDPPTPLTIADIQQFRTRSTIIAGLEAAVGINASNLASKVELLAGNGASTHPTTSSFKINIGKDQSKDEAIIAYAHELANAAQINTIRTLLENAKSVNNPKNAANKLIFAQGMAHVESEGVYQAILVVYQLQLETLLPAYMQTIYNAVLDSLDQPPSKTKAQVLQIIYDNLMNGTLKDSNGNPMIDYYNSFYDSIP